MTPLDDLNSAQASVLKDATVLLSTIREYAADTPKTVAEAIDTLRGIRAEAYEDLNQLPHEYLILRAAEWLVENKVVPNTVSWSWNPRQTGDITEPDLAAELSGVRLVSAEITASAGPIGKIDSRMAGTLRKLATMPGERYYFVGSEPMRRRATTKVEKQEWSIHVVMIGASNAL